MTTPNQQPEVSALLIAREIDETCLSSSTRLNRGRAAVIIQRALDRATEKLREVVKVGRQERDQLRAELDAQQKINNRFYMETAELHAKLYVIESKAKQADVLRAENEALRKDSRRLRWLHVCNGKNDKDLDGYEWGIYRVKFDQHGQNPDVQATFSDFSDLDEAMEREAAAMAKGEAKG